MGGWEWGEEVEGNWGVACLCVLERRRGENGREGEEGWGEKGRRGKGEREVVTPVCASRKNETTLKKNEKCTKNEKNEGAQKVVGANPEKVGP